MKTKKAIADVIREAKDDMKRRCAKVAREIEPFATKADRSPMDAVERWWYDHMREHIADAIETLK